MFIEGFQFLGIAGQQMITRLYAFCMVYDILIERFITGAWSFFALMIGPVVPDGRLIISSSIVILRSFPDTS